MQLPLTRQVRARDAFEGDSASARGRKMQAGGAGPRGVEMLIGGGF